MIHLSFTKGKNKYYGGILTWSRITGHRTLRNLRGSLKITKKQEHGRRQGSVLIGIQDRISPGCASRYFFGPVELLLLLHIKRTYALKEGTVPGTPGPPLRTVMVLLLPFLGLSHWGEPGGGGEIPMNVRVFKTFPMKTNMMPCGHKDTG